MFAINFCKMLISVLDEYFFVSKVGYTLPQRYIHLMQVIVEK